MPYQEVGTSSLSALIFQVPQQQLYYELGRSAGRF